MQEIAAKHILQRKKDSSWFGSDYNINLYQGCPHGCIYCDSRSACYGIEDFSRVRVKKDALLLLAEELRRCRKTGLAATGSMSDPYNPLEKEGRYTRGMLELLCRYRFGVGIATKSTLVLRDIDLLTEIAKHAPAIVKLTITTPKDELARVVEPHAPSSSERFAALEQLSQQGIFAGVLLMPVLPFLEDQPEQIRQLVRRCRECGAKFIYPYFGVTLRDRQREYFLAKLRDYSEVVWERYLDFGEEYQCLCPNQQKLWEIFCEECSKAGIVWKMREIITLSRKEYETEQLRLF